MMNKLVGDDETRNMRYVVVREDDVSYFTKPEILEKLYRPLFEEKKAVNFATIPNVSAKIKVPENNAYHNIEHLEYDPMIPPKFRGNDQNYPIDENKELLDYIKSVDCCEIAQHGFSHELVGGLPEFGGHDEPEIQRRADLGRRCCVSVLIQKFLFLFLLGTFCPRRP